MVYDTYYETELKKLSPDQRRSVLDLVVFYDMGFDEAIKEIRGR